MVWQLLHTVFKDLDKKSFIISCMVLYALSTPTVWFWKFQLLLYADHAFLLVAWREVTLIFGKYTTKYFFFLRIHPSITFSSKHCFQQPLAYEHYVSVTVACIKGAGNLFKIKGTLMQIWKSANIFVLIWKSYVEDFTLEHLLFLEICACEVCEKFVYKHSEIIE